MTLAGQVFDFSLTNGSFMSMMQKINSFTDVGQGGILGIYILLVVGGSLFFMMKYYGNDKALAPAALITAIIGIMLRLMSLVNDFVVTICVILLVFGLFLLWKDAAQYEQ